MQSVETHVALFFEFVCRNATPGDMIEADEMLEFYFIFCAEHRLVPRRWNPIAKDLKFLMAPGPNGSIKPYNNVLQPDGSYRETRVWFVPLRKATPPRARRKPRRPADPQSTPDLRAAA